MADANDNVKERYAAYKGGELSKDAFMQWLMDANEEGAIDDATYQKYSDIVDADVFADNDIPTFG